MEGYGLTETSPVIAVNRFTEDGRMFGSVGPLIENVQVKIAEDGEILCQGPNVMMGYYKRPDLTAEAIQDGWYYTGDIGTLVDDKFLKITDRKKELFKTSGGKELIESFNKFFNQVEQVKKFELLPDEWTVDTGEMTPKLSLKRKVVMEKYKPAIDRIYG